MFAQRPRKRSEKAQLLAQRPRDEEWTDALLVYANIGAADKAPVSALGEVALVRTFESRVPPKRVEWVERGGGVMWTKSRKLALLLVLLAQVLVLTLLLEQALALQSCWRRHWRCAWAAAGVRPAA